LTTVMQLQSVSDLSSTTCAVQASERSTSPTQEFRALRETPRNSALCAELPLSLEFGV